MSKDLILDSFKAEDQDTKIFIENLVSIAGAVINSIFDDKPLFIVYKPLFIVYKLLFIIYKQLFIVYKPLFIVYKPLFIKDLDVMIDNLIAVQRLDVLSSQCFSVADKIGKATRSCADMIQPSLVAERVPSRGVKLVLLRRSLDELPGCASVSSVEASFILHSEHSESMELVVQCLLVAVSLFALQLCNLGKITNEPWRWNGWRIWPPQKSVIY